MREAGASAFALGDDDSELSVRDDELVDVLACTREVFNLGTGRMQS